MISSSSNSSAFPYIYSNRKSFKADPATVSFHSSSLLGDALTYLSKTSLSAVPAAALEQSWSRVNASVVILCKHWIRSGPSLHPQGPERVVATNPFAIPSLLTATESDSLTTSLPLLPPVSSLPPDSFGSPASNDFPPVLPGYLTPPQSAVSRASQLVHVSHPEPPPVFPFPTTPLTREEYCILQDRLKTENSFPGSTPNLINDAFDDGVPPQSATTAPSIIWSDNSPRVENFFLPDPDLNPRPSEYMDFEPTQKCQPGFADVSNLLSIFASYVDCLFAASTMCPYHCSVRGRADIG